MPLEDLNQDEIDSYCKQLWDKLNDKPKGNLTLMRELGWHEDRYWDIRDVFLGLRVIEKGQGKGGSVRRASADKEAKAESDLYKPIVQVLKRDWIRDNGYGDSCIEITASQGKRKTGGKWTRPDIVIVSSKKHKILPGRSLDVTTFEVKPYDAIDVTSVYEALSHLRSATKAYVFLLVPDDMMEANEERLVRIRDEAVRHGIGVIVASDVKYYGTWETHVEAVRNEPDPIKLDEFLAT